MIFLGFIIMWNVLLNNEFRFYIQFVYKSFVVRYNFFIIINFGNIFLKVLYFYKFYYFKINVWFFIVIIYIFFFIKINNELMSFEDVKICVNFFF